MKQDTYNLIEDKNAEITFFLLGAIENLSNEDLNEIKILIEDIFIEYNKYEDNEIIEINKIAIDTINYINKKYENDKNTKDFIQTIININNEYINKKENTDIKKLKNQLHDSISHLTINKDFTEDKEEEVEKIQEEVINENNIKKILLFEMSDVIYGINSNNIVEIKYLSNNDIQNIPNVKETLLGLYNLRGEVIPLIDLRLFLNIKNISDLNYNDIRENMIISVKIENRITGLIVDRAIDFKEISESEMIYNSTVRDINPEYIDGIITNSEYDLIILLNINNFLSEDKLHDNFLL